MSEYYPQGIGKKIQKQLISSEDLQKLVNNFPSKTILRVFGFAGTGKGTLSSSLAQIFNIPNVESSLIWRGLTYIYEDLKLDMNQENSELVLSKLSVTHGQKNQIQVFYNGSVIDRSVLKSPLVDKSVAFSSGDKFLREKFYDIMIDYLNQIDSSCVLDGRGANPRYIQGAEKSGYKVIRLLLDASEEEMAHRYYSAYLAKKQKNDPNYIETDAQRQQMMEDFTQGIIARNKYDWNTWNNLNLGTITPDTAIFDTTGMTIEEVTQTVLCYIKNTLDL
jgi:cytidylate kinase